MKDEVNDQKLLKAYLRIWNNRTYTEEGGAQEVLTELIRRELLDENAHPRARKSIHEKYQLCVNRVMASSLTDEEKKDIITVYRNVQDKLLVQ